MPEMIDFKIRRGLHAELFPDGELSSNVVLELGCWYLCTDTAELFLCTSAKDRILKRINDVDDSLDRPTNVPGLGGGSDADDGLLGSTTTSIVSVELDSDNNLIFQDSNDNINIIELSTAITNVVSAVGYATEGFVKTEIAKAQLAGSSIDLDAYATKAYVTEQIAANILTTLDGGDV